jgi:TATA-binding protein-associated factor Taf7
LKADANALSISYEIISPHSRPASLAPSDFASPPSEGGLFSEASGSEDDFAGELEQMVQEADTPVPTPSGALEEDSSDDEEEEEGDREREKVRVQREQEIRELEETIVEKRIQVLGIVNPIVRERALGGLGRLEAELELKRAQLEEEE